MKVLIATKNQGKIEGAKRALLNYFDDIEIKEKLEEMGHTIELPNSYYEPDAENKSWNLGEKEYSEFKLREFRKEFPILKQVETFN